MSKSFPAPGLVLCLLVAGFGMPALADVYTYIDAQGNRVFTDQPGQGNAKRIDLAPLNEMSAQPKFKKLKPPAQVQPQMRYQLLRIVIPEPDSSVEDPAGNLIVTVSSEPALQEGHTYRLLLDGNPVGDAGRSPVFQLDNLDRGTHQLAVEIIDSRGGTLERTPGQPFHVRRLSLDAKRRVNPCKLADYGVRSECALKDRPEPDNGIPFIPFI